MCVYMCKINIIHAYSFIYCWISEQYFHNQKRKLEIHEIGNNVKHTFPDLESE